jgi:predicted nucleic acid-binding protein
LIVLDTNVISEPFRPRPDRRVIAWIAAQPDIAVSAISLSELFCGVARLPAGRRREALATSIESTLAAHVSKVLSYDGRAARVYAGMYERRRTLGRPLAVEDGMIAATAFVHGAALATRNVPDFADLGIEVIDPWST